MDVRSKFGIICWIQCCQQPNLLNMQRRCYQQLTLDSATMPDSAASSIESQVGALKEVAASQDVLLVLVSNLIRNTLCKQKKNL